MPAYQPLYLRIQFDSLRQHHSTGGEYKICDNNRTEIHSIKMAVNLYLLLIIFSKTENRAGDWKACAGTSHYESAVCALFLLFLPKSHTAQPIFFRCCFAHLLPLFCAFLILHNYRLQPAFLPSHIENLPLTIFDTWTQAQQFLLSLPCPPLFLSLLSGSIQRVVLSRQADYFFCRVIVAKLANSAAPTWM